MRATHATAALTHCLSYFWYRDYYKAIKQPLSPCFLNIHHPIDMAIGQNWYASATNAVREACEDTCPRIVHWITECFAPPPEELVLTTLTNYNNNSA